MLLRIKSLYTFRASPARPQEALQKRHLIYCVRARNIPSVAYVAPTEDEQVMLETYRGS
jgi:hypothetical protein